MLLHTTLGQQSTCALLGSPGTESEGAKYTESADAILYCRKDQQCPRKTGPPTTHALYKKAEKARSPMKGSENISATTGWPHLPTTQMVHLTFVHQPP